MNDTVRLPISTSQLERSDLNGLGMTFIRLFSHAIARGLPEEADDLVTGVGILYPDLDLAEMRVNVLFARRQYREVERLLQESESSWVLPWKALFAKQRNEANWRELAEQAVVSGAGWAALLTQGTPGLSLNSLESMHD